MGTVSCEKENMSVDGPHGLVASPEYLQALYLPAAPVAFVWESADVKFIAPAANMNNCDYAFCSRHQGTAIEFVTVPSSKMMLLRPTQSDFLRAAKWLLNPGM